MRYSYYYSQRLNKNKTNSLWTNRPKSGIIVGTSYLHPTPYLIGGTMPDQIIINEGDKLTIITQDSIAVCLVESIRSRQPETCCEDKPVCSCKEEPLPGAVTICRPQIVEDQKVWVQELQVMARNGKN